VSREHWERHAGDWAAWARKPNFDAYWEYSRAFFDLVPRPEKRTLDVGCGEGRRALHRSRHLSRRAPLGRHTYRERRPAHGLAGWAYPLEGYFGALEEAGFAVEALRVPSGTEDRWRRIPLFLMWRAVKTA